MPLLPRIEFTATATRRAFFATAIAAWLALALVVVGGGVVAVKFRALPRPVDVDNAINDYIRAEFFARNFLLVAIGGGTSEAAKLASMTTKPGQPTMNRDPYTVLNIDPVPPVLRTAAGKETEWALTMAATVIRPDSGESVRSYYRVTMLQAGGAFKALLWPRPVNDTSRAVEVKSYYTNGIGTNSPLGKKVGEFMTAYYAPPPSLPGKPQPGGLGSFVSSNFTDTAIAASPYATIEVKAINAAKDSPDTATAKPGTTVHVLVTAKASASEDTFNMIDAPLKMILSNNNQWLVDGFDEPIHFGSVSYK